MLLSLCKVLRFHIYAGWPASMQGHMRVDDSELTILKYSLQPSLVGLFAFNAVHMHRRKTKEPFFTQPIRSQCARNSHSNLRFCSARQTQKV